LYLLHGQFDSLDNWEKYGQLGNLLASVKPVPMLIVMPFCGDLKNAGQDPGVGAFMDHFDTIRKELLDSLNPSPPKEAILGISMGGRQALAIALKNKGVFSALGVLSGKLQGGFHKELTDELAKRHVPYPQELGKQLALYHHYCGQGDDAKTLVDGKEKTRSGDKKFYDNNKAACAELGGELHTLPDGMHNWNYWRDQIAEFIKRLSEIWGVPDASAQHAAGSEPPE
ncbi:MAG: esterase family protein, partial [Acidobacteria bacterium]|nr:esterase family protein [Acidobacteriota bacterium]